MKHVLAGLAALTLGLVGFVSAFAHAEPAMIKPGDGAVLKKAPVEVVITMSQEMFDRAGANDIDLIDQSGTEVTTAAAAVDRSDRKQLSVAVPSTLAPGKYTVKWKTLSADDGDAAEGELSFTFDPGGIENPGKEQLKESLDANTPAADSRPTLSVGEPSDGVTWVLVVAVGIAMFVLGAGGTFLLVQKRP